jgi:sortase A
MLAWIERALWLAGCASLLIVAASIGRGHLAQLRGAIDIRRLGLSVIVFEGTDQGTLEKGAGHLTSAAGMDQGHLGQGNLVIAGHRDTFFRPLRAIRPADRITVTTPSGILAYRVISTEVVDPSDLRVIAPSQNPQLTLVTCYPFSFIGAAPERFIVHAVPE